MWGMVCPFVLIFRLIPNLRDFRLEDLDIRLYNMYLQLVSACWPACVLTCLTVGSTGLLSLGSTHPPSVVSRPANLAWTDSD